jgi:hypothetical protein
MVRELPTVRKGPLPAARLRETGADRAPDAGPAMGRPGYGTGGLGILFGVKKIAIRGNTA